MTFDRDVRELVDAARILGDRLDRLGVGSAPPATAPAPAPSTLHR